MICRRKRYKAVIKLLLAKNDVDSNFKNKALSLVVGNGYETIIKLLLAKKNVTPNSKVKALLLIVKNKHDVIIKLLSPIIRNIYSFNSLPYSRSPFLYAKLSFLDFGRVRNY